MGFFGSYIFTDGEWHDWNPDVGLSPPVAEPWLSVEIHDSDFTTIRFAPADAATGVAYLGITPRIYFEDETASARTDTSAEAVGLSHWAREVVKDWAVEADAIRTLLATDQEPVEADGHVDNSEICVELKTAKFLRLVGLPLPEELAAIER